MDKQPSIQTNASGQLREIANYWIADEIYPYIR